MNYNTFEQSDLLRWGSYQLLDNRKDASFCDLPPEILHLILNFLVNNSRDLIAFSTIDKTCKSVADHSLLWLEVDLSFKLSKRFTSTFRLGRKSFILVDLPDRYPFPTASNVCIIQRGINSLSLSLTASNQHHKANNVRNKFMAFMISFQKKADDFLIFYKRAERINRMINSTRFLELQTLLPLGASMLSFDLSFLPFEINHLSVFNHLFFLSVILTFFLLCFGQLLLMGLELSSHIIRLDHVYLDRVFDNFEWEVVYFHLRDFFFCLGSFLTFVLIYIKCRNTSSINWWITMIPISLSTFLSLSIFGSSRHPKSSFPLIFILTGYYLFIVILNFMH